MKSDKLDSTDLNLRSRLTAKTMHPTAAVMDDQTDNPQEGKSLIPITEEELTLNDAIERIGVGRFHYRSVAILGCCWVFAAGTQVAFNWMLLDMKRLGFSSAVMGSIAAAQMGGQVVGFILFGFLGDWFGRRSTTIMSIGGLSACTAAMAFSAAAWHFMLLGFLKSVFYGAILLLTKNLCAELLPVPRRGLVLNGMHCLWQVGGIYATCSSYIDPNYQTIALFAALPGIPLLLLSPLIPESPRWLLQARGTKECQTALDDIAVLCNCVMSPWHLVVPSEATPLDSLEEQSMQVELDCEAAEAKPSSLEAANSNVICGMCNWLEPSMFRLVATLFVMWLCIEFSSNGMDTWILKNLEDRGAGELKQPLSFVQFGCKILGGISSAILVDITGRRTILVIAFFVAGIGTALFASIENETMLFVSVSLIYLNTEHVWSTITTYTSEVFPTAIRNQAAGGIHGVAVIGAGA